MKNLTLLKKAKKCLLLLQMLFLWLAIPAFAQSNGSYFPLDDFIYHFLDYEINRGSFTPDFVLQQPYTFSQIFSEKVQETGADYFHVRWKRWLGNSGSKFILRASDHLKRDEVFLNRTRAEGGFFYHSKNFTIGNLTTFDQNYKRDPHFAGDLSESENWLYGRINEAYLNLNFNRFNFFIGRTKRNWGPVNDYSLILSDNPYSYDHALFQYTAKTFRFSMIFAQLEDLTGASFEKPDSLIPNCRKFLVGHRLDLMIRPNFQIGFTEMATYGGPGRDFEFSFMNPANFYYPVQRNDRRQMDGFWAVDLFYKPAKKWTVYGQFLIDDIIVNNEPGINDRAQYPDRFAGLISLRAGDLIFRGTNFNLTYNRVWNRTYQSKTTWENYHYRGLGLGYPCAGCEELKFEFGYWGKFPLYLHNKIIWGRYGDVSLQDVFLMIKEKFPITPVKNNFIEQFTIDYFFNPSLIFSADLIYRKDPNHYSNRTSDKSNLIFKFGFSYLFIQPLPFD
ncbi:MAG: capsule assembly Wzi family protein [Calditrichaeota bacterium]|nr:capsule assembly Wzi family protein [Calditrichota bacterium]